MQKNSIARIKIFLPAGQATMGGPISSKFAFFKINTSAFLKEYNDITKHQIGYTVPAILTIFDDKTFSFILKTPPTSELILKHLKLEKGGKLGKKDIVARLSFNDVELIANAKLPDLNTKSIKKAINCVIGTAANMGILIQNV